MPDELIKEIEKIRDLPYEIGVLYEGEDLIRYGRGGCGPKHRYLADYLSRHGYKVKVCVGEYQWRDLQQLPPELKGHPKAAKTGHHTFLQIFIHNKWVTIDVSCDKGLYPKFLVNLNWDRESDQQVAIPIRNQRCFDKLKTYLSWRRKNITNKITQEDRDFSQKFNQWLESVRKDQI